MVSIEVKNLSLSYPVKLRRLAGRTHQHSLEFTALADVCLKLKAGDRVGVIGANGSGKTTLLKVLHGIYRPTGGTVHVEGRTDAMFNVSLGFRAEATGRRNIELRGLLNGWSEEAIAERMESIIAYSELGDFIDMPYKTYSQGMAARLAFASATAFEPEILLMDEWIGAGDLSFQNKARDRLSSLIESAGIVVLASHNHQILKSICDRGLILDNGRLIFFGGLAEALERSLDPEYRYPQLWLPFPELP